MVRYSVLELCWWRNLQKTSSLCIKFVSMWHMRSLFLSLLFLMTPPPPPQLFNCLPRYYDHKRSAAKKEQKTVEAAQKVTQLFCLFFVAMLAVSSENAAQGLYTQLLSSLFLPV